MSRFDNLFDPRSQLTGCNCGRHVNQTEHDYEAQRQLQCVEAGGEDRRYEGVIASAVMRAVFP